MEKLVFHSWYSVEYDLQGFDQIGIMQESLNLIAPFLGKHIDIFFPTSYYLTKQFTPIFDIKKYLILFNFSANKILFSSRNGKSQNGYFHNGQCPSLSQLSQQLAWSLNTSDMPGLGLSFSSHSFHTASEFSI